MRRSLLAAAVVLVVCFPVTVFAAKVKVWHQHTTGQYDKARFSHAVISSEGTLRLARQLKPLANLDATHVWDLAEDRDGNLFAATGDEGKVYKLTADGKTSVVYQGDDAQVFCLAVAADGAILAGTGPSGRVIHIDQRGAAKVLCETGDAYVWSLAVDPRSGVVYAGTGPKGRIHAITPDGKANVLYQTRQEHVLCLAVGPDGTLYAGTDKGGLVYRIDPKGKGFVLFQAAQAEVRSLKVTADGLYVGTSASNRSRGRSAASSGSGGGSSVASVERVAPAAADAKLPSPKEAKPGATGSSTSSESREASKGSPSPAPSVPSAGENSVYRITADGGVREVFREKALVLSLLRQGGHFFVGTGMEGQLFEVNEATRERSEIARLDHGQILALLHRKDGSIVLGTGDPGKLYVLQDKYAQQGSIVSEVLDAKIISKWGTLRWQADAPAGTAITVAVRSGNVSEPDETWSDWSAEQTDPERATVTAPSARFLQYRVTLKTNNPTVTPALRGLTVRYATANQAPEVTKVEAPDLNAVNLDNPKHLKFKWSATDANEDELTYALYVRKDGWKSWVQLEDDLEKTEYEWDTTTTPSGIYQIKVVASDRKDNAEAEALTSERISAPFVVSHEPPTVAVKVTGIDGDRVRLEATGRSPLVRLTAASFAINGKKWINVFPEDGLFDSKEETFRFETESLKPGTYVLVLRVRDAAGNTGSGDVVFTVKERGTK
jgi:outer membrane protein assembly factor BamB